MSGPSFLKLIIMNGTHKNDANTLYWHMANGSVNKFLIQVIQVTCFWSICASSSNVLEENNLTLTAYSFFSSTDFNAPLHLNVAPQLPSLFTFIQRWVISYQWQRCWAEQATSIGHWSKFNIASSVRTKTEKPDMHFSQHNSMSVNGPKTCTLWQ